MKTVLLRLRTHCCLTLFSQNENNCAPRLDDVIFYVKFRVNVFSSSKLLFSNLKSTLRSIKARLHFAMSSDKPDFGLGTDDCSLYTRLRAFKDDCRKNGIALISHTPVDFNLLWTLATTFIILARQTISFKVSFLLKLQFVGLLWQRMPTGHSISSTLKNQSATSNSFPDTLEYSEEINQSYTLILRIVFAIMLRQ